MEELKVIDGKVYKEVVTDELDSEIARRKDEIRRFENELVRLKDLILTLQRELDEMKGKAVEKAVQLETKSNFTINKI